MKKIIMLTLMAHCTLALIPDIGDFCYNDSCSNIQKEMWKNYQQLEGFESNSASLYSGSCYHTSPMYSNSYKHHAAVLIDIKDGKQFFSPRFSFYAKENPYLDWDIQRARQRDTDQFNPLKEILENDNEGFVDMLIETPPFLMYWMKTNSINNKLHVVGLWDARHRFICELDKN